MISDKESGGESYARVQQQQPRDGSRVSWRLCRQGRQVGSVLWLVVASVRRCATAAVPPGFNLRHCHS